MVNKITICDFCMSDECDCIMCELGNPCFGCEDYDKESNICKSNGGCAPFTLPTIGGIKCVKARRKQKGESNE